MITTHKINTSMLKPIAFLSGLVPIGIVIICATWSMQAGLAPACFPLTEGCVSISGSVRSVPVIYLFRAVMLPMSVVLFAFWWLNSIELSRYLTARTTLRRWILCLSLTGTAFLPLYVIFLGTDGPVYEFLRRLGIYVFFGATGIAQLLTTLALRSQIFTDNARLPFYDARHMALNIQFIFVVFMLLVGPLNLIQKQILEDHRSVENIIEWNFGLLMFGWYVLQGLVFNNLIQQRN